MTKGRAKRGRTGCVTFLHFSYLPFLLPSSSPTSLWFLLSLVSTIFGLRRGETVVDKPCVLHPHRVWGRGVTI